VRNLSDSTFAAKGSFFAVSRYHLQAELSVAARSLKKPLLEDINFDIKKKIHAHPALPSAYLSKATEHQKRVL
jgi:hypothetical protein